MWTPNGTSPTTEQKMLTAQQIIEALSTQCFDYQDCTAIITAIKSNKNLLAVKSTSTFKIGDRVKWESKKNPAGIGTVTKTNFKTCSVLSDSDDITWTVPSQMLTLL